MMKFLEITQEEVAELQKLMDAQDAVAIDAFFERKAAQHEDHDMDMEEFVDTIIREVVMNAHFLMHIGRNKEARSLLCGMSLLIEEKPLPAHAMLGFLILVRAVSEQRDYHEKERGEFHK